MAYQGVPFPNKGEQEFELRPVDVLAGSLVGECLIEFEPIDLRSRFLCFAVGVGVAIT